jgi:hypothetical protein
VTYHLTIENWTPTRVNELRGHWAKAARLKRVDANMVCGYAIHNRIPIAQGPREVSLRITLPPEARGKDEDAFWKSTLDALVLARMLIDDCTRYCRTGPVEIVRGEKRETRISLTDL